MHYVCTRREKGKECLRVREIEFGLYLGEREWSMCMCGCPLDRGGRVTERRDYV